MSERKTGITDTPINAIENDAFQITAYIEALSEFIMECDTPMTIAIQGGWGSGKTSIMQMIKESMGDVAVPVWFNTWQFSQFNMTKDLSITFLHSVIDTLYENAGAMSSSSKFFNSTKLKSWGKSAAVVAASIASQTAAEELKKDLSEDISVVKMVSSLCDEFKKCVEDVRIARNRDRIVVFVDDLDRLQPLRAVELLEVLKLFLDCEHCVFLLAIDTEVVYQGIRDKFGAGISNEKAHSFFDKIIQMPFKIPVGTYNMNGYIVKLMRNIWGDIEQNEKEDVDRYFNLIKITSGNNPRSIKRIVNAFTLMDKVAQKRKIYNNETKNKALYQQVLLAIHCFQLKFETAYQYLLKTSSNFDELVLKIFNSADSEYGPVRFITDDLKENVDDYTITERDELWAMLQILYHWSEELAQSEPRADKQPNYEIVQRIMNISSSTSVEAVAVSPQKETMPAAEAQDLP